MTHLITEKDDAVFACGRARKPRKGSQNPRRVTCKLCKATRKMRVRKAGYALNVPTATSIADLVMAQI